MNTRLRFAHSRASHLAWRLVLMALFGGCLAALSPQAHGQSIPVITPAGSTTPAISVDASPVAFTQVTLTGSDTETTDTLLDWSLSVGPNKGGTVSLNGGGTTVTDDDVITVDYTPAASFKGVETFTVRVTDEDGSPNTADLMFTVTVNSDPMIAVSGSASPTISEDSTPTPFSQVTLTGSDTVGETTATLLDWSLSTGPNKGGTVSLNSGGTTVTDDDVITVDYTPLGDFNGVETFTVRVTDEDGSPNTADTVFTVTVSSIDDDPMIVVTGSASPTISEDSTPTPFSQVTLTGSDATGETAATLLDWSLSTGPNKGGTVSLNGGGATVTDDDVITVDYTPLADFNGVETFTVRVTDEDGSPGTADTLFTVTVSSIDDDPMIVVTGSASPTISEDSTPTPFSQVTLTGSDATGETAAASLDWSLSAAPNNGGTVSLNGGGATVTDDDIITVDYTPLGDFNGVETFTVRVTDEDGAPGTADTMFTVTVSAVNDAPVITGVPTLPIIISEDEKPTAFPPFLLSATDVELNNNQLDWSISSAATLGTATLSHMNNNATTTVDYTPTSQISGNESFTVQVTDGTDPTTIVITVTVEGVNDDPVAMPDENKETDEDTPLPIDVLFNDTDEEDDTLTIVKWGSTAGSNDHHSLNGAELTLVSGKINFDPVGVPKFQLQDDFAFPGNRIEDEFFYTITDGGGGTDPEAKVTITVNGINAPPTAVNDPVSGFLDMLEDDPASPLEIDVLDNDMDEEDKLFSGGSPQTNVQVIDVVETPGAGVPDFEAQPSVNSATGEILFAPPADWYGTVVIEYRVTDFAISPKSATAFASVRVNSVNDAPVVEPDGASTTPGMAVNILVLDNDSDLEDDLDLTSVQVTVAALNGTTVVEADGTITYTPDGGFTGVDEFTYQVCDDNASSECGTAKVFVSIQPPELEPGFPIWKSHLEIRRHRLTL